MFHLPETHLAVQPALMMRLIALLCSVNKSNLDWPVAGRGGRSSAPESTSFQPKNIALTHPAT